MYQKPTEPLSIGGVLDDGFRLLKACFVKALILGAIVSFLTNVPSAVLQMSAADGDVGAMGAVAGILVVVCLFVAVVFYGALIALVSGIADGRDTSIGEACGVGMSRYWAVLGCLILYSLIVLLGYVALIIPGIILTVSLLFSNYLVVTDSLGPIDAIKKSHNLVWGDWWRTSVILTILLFIFMAIYMLVGIVSGMGAFFSSSTDATGPMFTFINLVVVPLMSAVITPVTYAFGVAIFNDLKLRKEGGDLDARIEALNA